MKTSGTSVTAIARNPDHLDLFVRGTDAGIYSAYWDGANGWSSFSRSMLVSRIGLLRSPVVARNPNHLDLFVTDTEGGIYSAYWDNASGTSSFFRIDALFATTEGTPVTAIARNPDHLDLFVRVPPAGFIPPIGTARAVGRRFSESTLVSG